MPDPTYVTIPDLTAATDGSINDNLLLEAAIPDGGDYVSRKVTKGQLVADLKNEISELGGLSDDVKQALLQIAAKAVYVDDGGPQYYQDLYDALYPPAQTYTVTNTLTGCTTNNAAASVTENAPYSATITASSGYSLTGATVSITMGGTDITATAYNNGTISIASVTGNLIITVTAVAVTLSSISAVYTQSGTVYDTDTLDSLKPDLVVTATWSDASTSTVASADYTLSGTLTAGTSTITVSYGGKTATFNVTVSPYALYPLVNGSHTFDDGTSVTVTNGKHVEINGINKALINLSDVSENTTKAPAPDGLANVQNKPKKFTLNSGQTVIFSIENKQATKVFSTNIYGTGTAGVSGFASGDISVASSNFSVTHTMTEDADVGCVFAAITQNSTGALSFDVSLVVDGIRYI